MPHKTTAARRKLRRAACVEIRSAGDQLDWPVIGQVFFSPVQAFLILPFERLQKVPLSLNIALPTRKSRLATGWPTSSEACHAANIDRSCSSRSAMARA